MKYLLTILSLLFIITFSSCDSKPTVKKTDLPVEVVTLKEKQSFDTVLVIKTDKKQYLFDNKKEYIGSYKTENDLGTATILGFLLGILVCLFIGIIGS